MGRVKYSFISKNDTLRTNILRLGNQKAPNKVKRYLLTSYNVNDVTERAQRDENGNVTNGTGSQAGIYFAYCNLTNAPRVFSWQ